jgi:hypothetical protein
VADGLGTPRDEELLDAEHLRRAFHEQVRLRDADAAPGMVIEHEGPIRRVYPPDPDEPGAMIESPEGLGDDPRACIAAQVAFFAGRGEHGQSVEWKTYGYDSPHNLVDLLVAAGFTRGADEVVLLGRAADLVHEVSLPEGVVLREIGSDADWGRVADLMDAVWGNRRSWVNDALRAEQRAAPERFIPVVAELGHEGPVLSYAALRLTPGTDFAGLWGGTTHPDWRRRGLYRAILAHRARRALEAGAPLVRVDTSPESRPILLGLGLRAVATTVPCELDFGERPG